MANLLNKLRMLDAEPRKAAPRPAPTAQPQYYHSQAVFPLSLFTDTACASPALLQSLYGCPFPDSFSREDVLFLDTETTGLSGGVGTVAFQIGVGYFTDSGFAVEQYLMHDYPQEPDMLLALKGLMKRFSVLCTFNGRTFDVPLLQSRFLMNRMADAAFPPTHADLLYPARRLWKLRLKRCSLGNLEEQLLHVKRDHDLPGAEVPQTYFQYLRDGQFAPLQRVLDHNKQDIVSLAQLFFFMAHQAARPEGISDAEDLFSLARAMEKNGQAEKAMHCYRLSAKTQLGGASMQAMARMEKRAGMHETAVKLYQSMLMRGHEPVLACVELAKLYEHQFKDIQSAASYTRKALLLLSEPSLFRDEAVQAQQNALQYRYARLRRKLSVQSTCK